MTIKSTVLFLFLVGVPFLGRAHGITPLQHADCFDSGGQAKKDSHCVCYKGRGSCPSGEGTCLEERCERRACETDKDCAAISAKCIARFCELPASNEKPAAKILRPGDPCTTEGAEAQGRYLDTRAGPTHAVDREARLICRSKQWILPNAP